MNDHLTMLDIARIRLEILEEEYQEALRKPQIDHSRHTLKVIALRQRIVATQEQISRLEATAK